MFLYQLPTKLDEIFKQERLQNEAHVDVIACIYKGNFPDKQVSV